jgi:hypothetical protein
MFGSALLEGLRGTGLKPNCDDQRCVTNLDPLLGYCKQRIPFIGQQRFNQAIKQEVRLSGDYVQDPITEVSILPAQLSLRPPTSSPVPLDRLPVHPDVPPNWRPDSFHEGHGVFGSERVTASFLNARVFSYSSGQWLAPKNDFRIYAVKYSTDRQIYELDLGLTRNYLPDTIYWLRLADPLRTFGVIMPTARQKIRYQLQLYIRA